MPSNPIHHDVNDVRPGVIERFVGQRHLIDRIRVALEAAWTDGTRLPHMLFVGASGLGKTSLAELLARETGCPELRQQLGQNLNHPSNLHAFLLDGDDRGVLFVDEVHQLLPHAQTLLYRALEEQQLFLPRTISGGDKAQVIPLANFSLLAATTDQFTLLSPLLNRFKVIGHFQKYSADELHELLSQRCQMLGWQIEPNVLPLIARLGRGVPRHALRILEAVRRTSRAEGAAVMTAAHFQRTCQLERIDDAGLDELEQRYLAVLRAADGTTRLNILAARLGLPAQTIQRNVEAALIEEGFIEKQLDGQRTLTERGRRHADQQIR